MDDVKINTLKEKPNLFKSVEKLIEKSFGYSSNNKFAVDFYPLIRNENFENCYVLIDNEGTVLAHIGVLKNILNINGRDFEVIFYGGIAVHEKAQGKGLFKKLFKHVLEVNKETTFHLLWSDLLDLYEKFDFFPAITQFQYPKQDIKFNSNFYPSSLTKLTAEEFLQIKNLYQNKNEIRVQRDNEHWELLKNISSADLYLKKVGNEISNYFIMNKGEDLTGIIHEYGNINASELREMLTFGTVWTPEYNDEFERDSLFGSLIKFGNEYQVKQFIEAYTSKKLIIEKIRDNIVHFEFEQGTYSMGSSEFLLGIFGPNKFQELSDNKNFYIPGLNSI